MSEKGTASRCEILRISFDPTLVFIELCVSSSFLTLATCCYLAEDLPKITGLIRGRKLFF